jgi:hypothetical protein
VIGDVVEAEDLDEGVTLFDCVATVLGLLVFRGGLLDTAEFCCLVQVVFRRYMMRLIVVMLGQT